ncbi:MAG: HPP family protein [Sulfuricellaceae bacterium]|jgi:CBS domain-containing protein
MTIAAVPLSPEGFCLDPDASLMDALRLMLDKGINHVPVCDPEGFVGIVGINDILLELIPVSARVEHGLADLTFAGDAIRLLAAHVEDLKHRPVKERVKKGQVLDENCPLLEAALLLSQVPSPLPVVGAQGEFRGMLSRRALLSYLVAQEEG